MLLLQFLKIRMQYRGDFLISTVSLIAQNLLGFVATFIIFKSINTLNGWDFYQITFLYSFAILACMPQQLFFDNIWSLSGQVRGGDFIKYYFKPINMLFYYMSEVFDIKGLGTLVIGIVMMSVSAGRIGIIWTPWNILLLISLLLCASLVVISMLLMAGSLAFWFINSQRVLIFISDAKNLAWYPLNIYNGAMKFFFTFLIPVGFISYYPAQLLLSPENISAPAILAPFAGIGLFALAYQVWKKGVNSYSGTGS
jgi:ABC-2 type transport system permease protein